jgi:hypothetical protein
MISDDPNLQYVGRFLQIDEDPIEAPIRDIPIKKPAPVGRFAWFLRLLLISIIAIVIAAAAIKDPGYVDPSVGVEPEEGDLVVIKVDRFGGILEDPYYGNDNSTTVRDRMFMNTIRLYIGNPGKVPISTKDVEVRTTMTLGSGVTWFTSEFDQELLQPRYYEVVWVMGPSTYSHQNDTLNIHVSILYNDEVIEDYRKSFDVENGRIRT